ncbi:MAG: RNA-binding protein [Calditrichaeota bacterium]|nr:RNA-binding protein [Candidatus Cloacimonadota bacterium]MCA9784999.1 RNA-binding protein [Candidatus Cloacimonadota bacterium]MCB1046233.1 RNA-binding protein [Calditrichota bacterium]MCB9474220.1 RNA-binding protein [Candidatus Delongbacteria bacterium]
MNIYVGNLPYGISEDELRDAFSEYGAVTRASIVMDRETGRSKGFGFVEMSNKAEGEAAINGLNEASLKGRNIKVNEARPRTDRGPRGGGY